MREWSWSISDPRIQALADMGYAEKSGRWFNRSPVWVALAPDEQP
jgi:hypothetical protein